MLGGVLLIASGVSVDEKVMGSPFLSSNLAKNQRIWPRGHRPALFMGIKDRVVAAGRCV